jgi:hypothetical protein
MRKSLRIKLGAIGTTFALAGALAIASSGTTGAYFSDTKLGGVTGTVGSVTIGTAGGVAGVGQGISFVFSNLAPGKVQTATVTYTNTGTLAQDIYLTFPSITALHALNNLKTDGHVYLVGGKTGGQNLLYFSSSNLNDGRTDQNVLLNSCALDGLQASFVSGNSGCVPLNYSYRLASNVAPGGTGTFSFSFNYPSTYGNPVSVTGTAGLTGGGLFNSFPVNEAYGPDAAEIGDGLPFQIIATEVGVPAPDTRY